MKWFTYNPKKELENLSIISAADIYKSNSNYLNSAHDTQIKQHIFKTLYRTISTDNINNQKVFSKN